MPCTLELPKMSPIQPSSQSRFFANFSEKTTFHGFRELYDSRTWFQRFFWIVIMTASTAMLCVDIREQVNQYFDGQVVTKSVRPSQSTYQFPQVLLRLFNSTWIDSAKLRLLNLTYEEAIVARGYMIPDLEYESNESPLADAKRSLKTKLARMGIREVSQLSSDIAWGDFDGSGSNLLMAESTFNFGHATYRVNATPATRSQDYVKSFESVWQFNFTAYDRNINETFAFLRLDRSDLSKPVLFNPDTNQWLPIEPGMMYQVSVDCRVYRQLYDCTNKENENPLYYPENCKFDCMLRSMIARNMSTCYRADTICGGANLELTEHFRAGLIPLCYLGAKVNGSIGREADIAIVRNLTAAQSVQMEKELGKCRAACLPKCERWSTTWGVISYPRQVQDESLRNSARITVNYPGVDSLIITEEVERYKWHDIVSNIGGLLGLWLGASVMSLFQIVHLCFWDVGAKGSVQSMQGETGRMANNKSRGTQTV